MQQTMRSAFRRTIRNDAAELQTLCEDVCTFVEEISVPCKPAYVVCLAVEEMMTNVIKYSYDDAGVHDIHLDITCDGQHATIRLQDDGHEFNPLLAPPPNKDLPVEERPVGGLGIYLVRKMVNDDMTYQREDGWNILTIRIPLQDDEEPCGP
ncbi:ATP-binding protein [Verrucomicrobia bacterium LW23]|nr:ATP-binding protein [Verrucomicrobia bacterium LW23]